MLNANFFISRDSPPPPSPRFEEEIYTGRFRLKSKLKEENPVGSVPSDDDGKIYDEIYEEEVYKTRSVDTDDGWESGG